METPLTFLRSFSKKYPRQAALIFGAIACFAAVSFILSFVDLESSISSIVYVFMVGTALFIVTHIINDKIIMRVLSWFFVFVLLGWVLAYIGHLSNPNHPQLLCLAKFLQACKPLSDERAAQNSPATPFTSKLPKSDFSNGVDPTKYKVYFQFAGFARAQVQFVMAQLSEAGWRVQGVAGGGERTSTAAGLSEVRYGVETDAKAAQSLASFIDSSSIKQGNTKTVLNPSIKQGNLEVYIGLR